MRELNPIGREENQLLLVSSDGERFTIEVDDALMRTLKEHKVPDGSGVQLTPRQIQDAIRAGSTIAELAETSGTSISLIERFAHPVIEELQHMVELAKAIRIELPADRFNDVVKKEFGELVEEKLHSASATSVKWSAKRTENGIWEIHVEFETTGNTGNAVWTFDPRKYLLTPETSTAQNLSNPSQVFDSPLGQMAKPAPIVEPRALSETVVTEDKLQAFRSRRERNETVVEEPAVAEIPEPQPEPEPDPEPVFELEPEIVPEPAVETATAVIEPIAEDLGEESQVEEIVETPASQSVKKNRAPMPSWDQIVRGTQSDDGEAF